PPTAYLHVTVVPSSLSENSHVMLPLTPMRPSGPSPPDSRSMTAGFTKVTTMCTTPPCSPSLSQKQPCTRGSRYRLEALPETVWSSLHQEPIPAVAALYTSARGPETVTLCRVVKPDAFA